MKSSASELGLSFVLPKITAFHFNESISITILIRIRYISSYCGTSDHSKTGAFTVYMTDKQYYHTQPQFIKNETREYVYMFPINYN